MNTTTLAEKTTLQQLQEQRDALAMRAEIAGIEAALRVADLSSRVVESEWGELVNRREYLSDTPGFGRGEYDQRATSANDRLRGKLYPIFENEQDLAWIRGVGRFIASHHEVGVGLLENLVSFTLGNGLVYEPQSRRKGEASPALLADVSAALDEFHEANGWTCEDGSNSLEEELLTRDVVDGEFIVWVDGEPRVPRVRIPEPDFLTEPADVATVEGYAFGDRRHLDWSFGVASDRVHTDEQVAYYFQWEQASSNWDVIGAHEVVHSKRSVPRRVKRGVSDFFAVYQNIERASKLLGNTLQGAAVQSTIAYIREHAAGTPQTAIESFATGRPGSVQQIIPKGNGATRTGRTEKFNPGRVIDTAGTKYHAGPLGQSSAPTYVDVMQAALRVTGVRWSMPEHMISGDASNANYSSTLVAGGPFDRATQRRQGGYKGKFGKIHWLALAAYCKKGRFSRRGIYTLADLRAAVELSIDAPDVSIENKMETEQIRKLQYEAGIMSKRSWAGKAGLDWEQEQASIKAETPPAPPMIPGATPGQQQQQQVTPPIQESTFFEGGIGSNQYQDKPSGKMDGPKKKTVGAEIMTRGTADRSTAVKKLLGDNWKDYEAGTLFGMPKYTRMSYGEWDPDGNSVVFEFNDENFQAERKIYKDASGKLVCKNSYFEVQGQKSGLGAKIFTSQVELLSNNGFDRIVTDAARCDKDGGDTFVGYKVWPKFGYDGPLSSEIKKRLANDFAGRIEASAQTVQQLYKTKDGMTWWEKNGTGINLTFDLNRNSESRRALARYTKAKGITSKSIQKMEESILMQGKSDDPCSEDDDEILNQIWSDIHSGMAVLESRNPTREAAIAAALESVKSPEEAAAIMRTLRESYP